MKQTKAIKGEINMNIREVKEKMLSGGYILKYEEHFWLKENHVIDENKSADWNKKEVKRRNEESVKRFNERTKRQLELYDKMDDDLIKAYVKAEPEFNYGQIKFICEEADKATKGYVKMFDKIEEIIQIVKQVNSLK